MAKGIRSKVKKRFRTVKRGVVKKTLAEERNVAIREKLKDAAEGDIKAGTRHRPHVLCVAAVQSSFYVRPWPGGRELMSCPCSRCLFPVSHCIRLLVPGYYPKNAFKSDDPDAAIPQHKWQPQP